MTENEESNKSLVRNKVKRNLRNKTKCNSDKQLRIKTRKTKTNSDKYLIQRYIKPEKRGFSCVYNDCGQQFLYMYEMKRHIRRHLGIKPFICEYKGCDYKCVEFCGLNLHISLVHQSKDLKRIDLKCNECKTSFETKFDLNTHKSKAHPKTNSNENEIQKYIKRDNNKQVVCLYKNCGKRFTQSYNIIPHIRSHLGIKPFKCQYKGCDYKFVSSSHLKTRGRQGGGIAKIPPPLRSKISKIPPPPLSFEIFRRPPPLAASRSEAAFCRKMANFPGNSAILLAIFGNFGNLRLITD